jgi:hypothetical protein
VGHQVVEKSALSRPQREGHRRHATGEVDGRDIRRTAKTGAPFAVTGSLHRGVDHEHQGFEACGLGALHPRSHEAAVRQQVELEPQRAAVHLGQEGAGHVFEPRAGLGAEHQPGPQCSCGERCGLLAVRLAASRGQWWLGVRSTNHNKNHSH